MTFEHLKNSLKHSRGSRFYKGIASKNLNKKKLFLHALKVENLGFNVFTKNNKKFQINQFQISL